MNEARLRELHHRVPVSTGSGLVTTRDGKQEEIISAVVHCCSCLGGNWEAGPCQTLEAIEDDSSLKDVVEIVTWSGEVVRKLEIQIKDVVDGT